MNTGSPVQQYFQGYSHHIREQLQKPAPDLLGTSGVDIVVLAAVVEAVMFPSSSSSSSEPLSTTLLCSKASTLHLKDQVYYSNFSQRPRDFCSIRNVALVGENLPTFVR